MSAGIHTKEGFEAVYNATKEIFNLQAEGLLIDDSFMSGNTAKFQRKVLTKMANLEYAGKDFLAKKYSKLYHALETVKKNNAEKGMNKVLRVALKIGMAIALFTVELAKTSLDVVFTIIMTAFNLVLNLGVQVVEAVKNAISFVTTKDEVLA